MNCLIGISGLGDYWDYAIVKVKSQEDAEYLSWHLACEQYESYVGSNGIRDVNTIMEEDNYSYEDALEIFKDDREMWIDYWFSFNIETKVKELLEDGLIDSVTEINNYEKWKNQD